jgi:hypothetical protein
VIERVDGGKLVVRLEDSDTMVRVLAKDVTNYSLAARKAWVTDPHRGVGRRKGTRLCDRVSVTLRVDRELWELFQELENRNVIDDRTAIINQWFREKLTMLDTDRNR